MRRHAYLSFYVYVKIIVNRKEERKSLEVFELTEKFETASDVFIYLSQAPLCDSLFSINRNNAADIERDVSRFVRPDKIIKRSRNLLQFYRGIMLIQIIVTLLLAGRVISSVSVQGSISIVNNDTMTIYLHTGKSSVGDGPDKLFRKLHEAKPNPRIHLVVYLGEKIVVIEGELENYLSELTRFKKKKILLFSKTRSYI